MEIKAEFEKLKVTPQRRNLVDSSKAAFDNDQIDCVHLLWNSEQR